MQWTNLRFALITLSSLIFIYQPNAQEKISDGVVRIGVLTDLSGMFSGEAGQGSIAAVKMAVEDFGGKVLDKPIEVVFADHQNKTDIAAAKAREWYDVNKVDMIANLVNSGVALAVSGVAKEKKRIAIVTTSGSSRLTMDSCNANTVHYVYDTYALANGTVKAMIKRGDKSWYFLTADYAFGQALENDASSVLKKANGQVVGSLKFPPNSSDHSSFFLTAQNSKASVIGLATSGSDFINLVKTSTQFGIQKSNQKLAALLVWISDIHSIGLQDTQGLILTNGFYWDRTPETRDWSKRFFERMKKMPNMGDAGDYSSTLHYLKAIQAAGTDESSAVMAKMRELPINDFFAKNGKLRIDGRMVHDLYLYQVKNPSESKYPWDYLSLLDTIPGDEAFRPLSESTCPLVKK
jgi:branched-chain amino acid transport system substrate-binding protein